MHRALIRKIDTTQTSRPSQKPSQVPERGSKPEMLGYVLRSRSGRTRRRDDQLLSNLPREDSEVQARSAEKDRRQADPNPKI